jgi:hypothetical protein
MMIAAMMIAYHENNNFSLPQGRGCRPNCAPWEMTNKHEWIKEFFEPNFEVTYSYLSVQSLTASRQRSARGERSHASGGAPCEKQKEYSTHDHHAP